ncbi:MAG: OmpA family protein [Endomicrobiia bacterium]
MKIIEKNCVVPFLVVVLLLGMFPASYAARQSISYAGEDILTINLLNASFSPNGDGIADELVLNFNFLSDQIKIKNWQIEIINLQTNEVVETFSSEKEIPKILKWDGVQKNKGIVEGSYKYIFTAVINNKNIQIEQDNIVVDITAPYLSLTTSSNMVVLKENKFTKDIVFVLNVGDETSIDINKSKFQIENSKGEVIKERIFSLGQHIPQKINWNGKDSKNKQVPPGVYKAILTVSDIVDNKGIASQNIAVFDKIPANDVSEIKIEKDPRGLVINLYSDISFGIDGSVFKKNLKKSLKRIIRLLNEYHANKVIIKGYSNSAEKDDENLEISKQRAENVYSYFVKEGISADRLQFIGYGKDSSPSSDMIYKGMNLNRIASIIILEKERKSNSIQQEKNK